MKTILLSLCAAGILMGANGDSQSILNEVAQLRQKYDECRASQGAIKGIDPKVLAESRDKNQKLLVEINRKNGVIKSLEETMVARDRSYRETNARNKNLISQLHTQQVTEQEREMLKRALISAKGELALAQKELKGGSTSIVQMRSELKAAKAALATLQSHPVKVQTAEKIVTKTVEPTEKIRALQLQLNAANLAIAQLRSVPSKTQPQQPQVVYRDRIVTQEKVVYKDRSVEKAVVKSAEPTEKIRSLQLQLNAANSVIAQLRSTAPKTQPQQPKVVYRDRIVTQEKVVYKDHPVEKVVIKSVEPTAKIEALKHELANAQAAIENLKKSGPNVVYKDRIVTQEKVVYKDRPVEKVVIKSVEPTAKIEALKHELANAQAAIANLKKSGANVVYKDRIVTQEKVVYKDRPVEKVVIKSVEPTEKIEALKHELANAQAAIANLKKSGANVVYKDRIVTQEKVVYKDRPVEKVVTKTVVVEKPTVDENTRRQMDKLALELERQKTLNLKLASNLSKGVVKQRIATAALPPLPPVSPSTHSVAKTITAPAVKSAAPAAANTARSSKKSSGVYRMAANAPIYNGPNGRAIDTWEARRSFTGSGATDGWIHITGYFVNRVFQGTGEGENLWVKESDAIRR